MGFKGKSVLVVEDMKGLRERYCKDLAKLGFDVSSASTAKEATNAIKLRTFDLIWLDLQLDGDEAEFEGQKLIRYIRDLDEGSQLLIVSKHDSVGNVRKAMKNKGADDFLSKSEIDSFDGLNSHIDLLADLVASSTISEPVELDKAIPNFFNKTSIDFETSRIISSLKIDATSLHKMLKSIYNNIKPAFKMHDEETVFKEEIVQDGKIFVGQMWSKRFGSCVNIYLNTSEAKGATVFRRNKPFEAIVVKCEGDPSKFIKLN